jgi:putative FmdB family regulatory protein
MPIFEYRCSECGAVNEVLERSGGQNQQRCPKCGSRRMEKLFSTFASGGASASAGDCSAPRRGGFK